MSYNRGQLVANHPKPNHNSAAEYQGSCVPFVTSSQVGTTVEKIKFPRVTRFIVVSNRHGSNDLSFGFTVNGLNGPLGTEGNASGYEVTGSNANYFTLDAGQMTDRLEIKCDGLFIKAAGAGTDFSIIAGITNVSKDQFLKLSGSDGWQGVG